MSEDIITSNEEGRQIILASGDIVLVSCEDYDYLNQWKWWLSTPGYARRIDQALEKPKAISMHRVILPPPNSSLWIDHINGNKLDNRRSNLRLCTPSQNSTNVSKRKKNASSRFKGVCLAKYGWQVDIWADCKHYYVGTFKDEVEAASAYNDAAIRLQGEFARLNDLGPYNGPGGSQ